MVDVIMLGPILAECSKCSRKRPLTEFSKNKTKKDGVNTWCKSCQANYHKKYREANKINANNLLKVCSKCNIEKPKTEFYKNKSRSGNPTPWCKLCCREYEKEKRRDNIPKDLSKDYSKVCLECNTEKHKSEYYKDRTRNDGLQCYCKLCSIKLRDSRYEKILRRWEEVIIKKEGKPFCQCCGESLVFPSSGKGRARNVIHFDHKTGEEAIENPTGWLRRNPVTKENIKFWYSCDFGMLCWGCNFWLGDPKIRRADKENIKTRLRIMLKNVDQYIGDEE
jgi:hypothetical protein